jgi:hypothetical protein
MKTHGVLNAISPDKRHELSIDKSDQGMNCVSGIFYPPLCISIVFQLATTSDAHRSMDYKAVA